MMTTPTLNACLMISSPCALRLSQPFGVRIQEFPGHAPQHMWRAETRFHAICVMLRHPALDSRAWLRLERRGIPKQRFRERAERCVAAMSRCISPDVR